MKQKAKGIRQERTNGLPPYIVEALGKFDLDPCSPENPIFHIADKYYTEYDNGIILPWEGRVFCNPPYGDLTGIWLEKCAMHKNAIALVFARTETAMFFNYVWNAAYGILFIKGRISFYHSNGQKGDSAGAPSVLIAYNKETAEILKNCKIKGKYIELKNEQTINNKQPTTINS